MTAIEAVADMRLILESAPKVEGRFSSHVLAALPLQIAQRVDLKIAAVEVCTPVDHFP